MNEHKPLYRFSLSNAKKYGEVELWRESHKENCVCAREIENGISDNYSDNSFDTDFAKNIISKFGFNRVMWVLCNTIQRNNHDGRFSPENKNWAKATFIPNDSERWHYEVTSHQGLVNLFTDRVRKEWDQLGLYDRTHCIEGGDYEDKIIVSNFDRTKEYSLSEIESFKVYEDDEELQVKVTFKDGFSETLFGSVSTNTEAFDEKYYSIYNFMEEMLPIYMENGAKGEIDKEDMEKLREIIKGYDKEIREAFEGIVELMS